MSSQPPPPDPPQVVLTFLESIGRRTEAEFYVRLFRELPKESFALIIAHDKVVSGALGSLVEQLRFLAELDLFAPVVLGLSRPNKAHSEARRLAQYLPQAGLTPHVHSAEETDLSEVIRDELRHESVPIIYFNAASAAEMTARFQRIGRLARSLDSRKIVILRPQGGFRPTGHTITLAGDYVTEPSGGGAGLSVINLREDYETLRHGSSLAAEDSELLRYVNELLTNTPEGNTAVSITSPLNLLKELFTVRGAGTLIKAGAKIVRHLSYESVDIARLRLLLESTFGRSLAADFFERPVLDLYLEEDYRGAAILEPSALAPYLTKFAVNRVAQGEGIGRDLWAAMTRDHPRLYWRAKSQNPIASWYMSQCQGMVKKGDWHIYWRGLEPDEIAQAIFDVAKRGEDFAAVIGS